MWPHPPHLPSAHLLRVVPGPVVSISSPALHVLSLVPPGEMRTRMELLRNASLFKKASWKMGWCWGTDFIFPLRWELFCDKEPGTIGGPCCFSRGPTGSLPGTVCNVAQPRAGTHSTACSKPQPHAQVAEAAGGRAGRRGITWPQASSCFLLSLPCVVLI